MDLISGENDRAAGANAEAVNEPKGEFSAKSAIITSLGNDKTENTNKKGLQFENAKIDCILNEASHILQRQRRDSMRNEKICIDKIEKLEKDSDELICANSKLKFMNMELSLAYKDLQDELEKLQIENENLNHKNEQLQIDFSRLKSYNEVNAIYFDFTKTQNDLKQTKTRLKQLEMDHSHLKEAHKELEEQNEALREKTEELELLKKESEIELKTEKNMKKKLELELNEMRQKLELQTHLKNNINIKNKPIESTFYAVKTFFSVSPTTFSKDSSHSSNKTLRIEKSINYNYNGNELSVSNSYSKSKSMSKSKSKSYSKNNKSLKNKNNKNDNIPCRIDTHAAFERSVSIKTGNLDDEFNIFYCNSVSPREMSDDLDEKELTNISKEETNNYKIKQLNKEIESLKLEIQRLSIECNCHEMNLDKIMFEKIKYLNENIALAKKINELQSNEIYESNEKLKKQNKQTRVIQLIRKLRVKNINHNSNNDEINIQLVNVSNNETGFGTRGDKKKYLLFHKSAK